jgi:uncharacterized protein YndB with AHSA1/START domain
MVRKVLIGVGVVVVLLGIVIATRPGDFRIERSAVIAAPPETVFAQVDDFHKWSAWSPWDKLDPQMKRTYTGPAHGKGAVYEWTGNKEVGEGRMTIEESVMASKIGIKLEFLKPFAATNETTFTFTPAPEGTKVLWAMEGHNDFMGKAFGLFMNMDKMVGGDFERGLANLKQVAESAKNVESPKSENP